MVQVLAREKGERLGLLALGFDLDTPVVSLLSPARPKFSSTDTTVIVFCCGGRRYGRDSSSPHPKPHSATKWEALSRSKWEPITAPFAAP